MDLFIWKKHARYDGVISMNKPDNGLFALKMFNKGLATVFKGFATYYLSIVLYANNTQ